MIESRLIGDVLVLATQGWTNRSVLVTNVTTGNGFVFDSGVVRPSDGLRWTNVVSMFVSEAFTLVSSVDLSDPAVPVVRSSIRSTESPTAIHATDRLLFVAKSSNAFGWFDGLGFGQAVTTNIVEVFDVSDRSGLLRRTGSFSTSGRVADKFKFGLDGEVLTVVSQVDGRWNGNASGFQPPRVVLETFSMTDPAAPVRLGQLNLVTNENVFATRYDAGRAYVVTFRQVDPLWIVDLADGKVRESRIDDRGQEFPRVDERLVGKRHRYGYAPAFADENNGGDRLHKHDFVGGGTAVRDFGSGKQLGEFVFHPRSADAAEDDGVLMGYVYDQASDCSELAILDAQTLGDIASVKLPHRVPAGFHGNWLPTSQ
jgi:hypothetical protein